LLFLGLLLSKRYKPPAKKYIYNLVEYLKKKNANLEVDFSDYGKGDGAGGIGNKITISYRMKRGVDMAGDLCRIVVITKFPLMDISDGYIKSLFLRFGNTTWSLLNDIATQDVIQMVCRGLRNDNDWCMFSTPDIKVYEKVEKWWKEQLKIKGAV